MKQSIKYIRNITTLSITLFALLFASCKDVHIGKENLPVENEQKVAVSIRCEAPVRSAFPEIAMEDFVSFVLECDGLRTDMWTYDEETDQTAYQMMTSVKVELPAGEHDFVLTGFLKTKENYQAAVTQTIQENSVLVFKLIPASFSGTGTGSFSPLYSASSESAKSWKMALYSTEDGKTHAETPYCTQQGTNNRLFIGLYSIPSGLYILIVTFYANNDYTLPVYEDEELVAIVSGKNTNVSKADVPLQKVGIINYYPNGGMVYPQNKKYTPYMDVELETPSKSKLDFGGWYKNEECTGDEVTSWTARTYVGDINLYAKWNYTVTFDGNGSEEEPVEGETASVSGQENHAVTLPANGFTREGYLFEGWTLSKDGNGTVYEDSSSSFKASTHVTLYAKWKAHEADKVAVSFRSNGGGLVDIQQLASGSTVTEPAVSRTGYELDGWYTTENFTSGTKVDFTTYKPEDDVILYAKWTAENYNIIYLDSGNSDFSGTHESGYSTTHAYDTDTLLDIPTKNDFVFGGWYLTSDASGQTIKSLDALAYTNEITLYAKWIRQVYHVSAEGLSTGDGSSEQPYATISSAVSAIQSAASKLDYTILVSGRIIGKTSITASDLAAENAKSLTIRGATNNESDILDGNENNYVLQIGTAVPVTLKDIKITKGKSSVAGGILITDSSTQVTLASGVLVTENTCTDTNTTSGHGGGITLNSGSLIIEEGAKITNNTSKYGGGINISGNSSSKLARVVMKGGEISGNTVSVNGGGVLISNNSNFTMNGGKITNNTAATSSGGGGGVSVTSSSGIFIMNGGEISENTSGQYGGGVEIDSSGTFTMNGGIIKNNVAGYGGGVSNYGGSFTMTGAAYIPIGEDNKNDVFLNYSGSYMGSSGQNRYIIITEELTAQTPVATITSGQMIENKYLLYSNDISLLEHAKDKFAYNTNDGTPWNVEISGSYVMLKRPVYNITYLEKGGDELQETLKPSDNVTHKYGKKTELPVITKPGYVFLGWYTESDCSGIRLTELAENSYTSDITLYADWEEELITITVLSDDISITKREDSENGRLTLVPAAGFTDYTWTINGAAATSVIEGATLSSTDSSLTFSKANLTKGRSYSIVLTAKNANGKTFMTVISIKK